MNKLQAIVSSAMAVATAFATAAAVNNDVSPTLSPVRSSSLSSGLWIKIHIDEEGIYQLSHERLRELGFSNPKTCMSTDMGRLNLWTITQIRLLTIFPKSHPFMSATSCCVILNRPTCLHILFLKTRFHHSFNANGTHTAQERHIF